MHYTRRIHPRAKSLKITIAANGEVVVTTPRFVPEFAVKRFVTSHRSWINTRLAELTMKKKKLLGDQPNQMLFFGESFTIETKLDTKKPIGVTVNTVKKILQINPVSSTSKSIQRGLKRFLESTLREYIETQVHTLAQKMNVEVFKITFRRQSTRWGSCSSVGNLNFNWQLIHAPQEVIDYVIIHELAHRTHMNHSRAFWHLVEQIDPEYRKHRGWLKRHGMILQSQEYL